MVLNFWADARKRYTAMVPRHKGVHMNTPWHLSLSRDADWSTKPCTAFWHHPLAVHRFEASQVDSYRFCSWGCTEFWRGQSTPSGAFPRPFAPKRSWKKFREFSEGWTQQRLCLESEERVVFLVSAFVLIANPIKPTPYFTNKVVPCPPTLLVQRHLTLHKNLNASRPTEHPPARGEKILKRSHFSCILA